MQIYTFDEFEQYAKANPISWLIEDRFKEGSFNLFVGGPKCGKSTLLRQLAVCVTLGTPFLRETAKQGGVLFLAPDETNHNALAASFKKMGVDRSRLYLSNEPVHRADLVAVIESWIEKHPGINLAILDTLTKCVDIPDLNDYQATQNALEPLVQLASRRKVTIIGNHHTNKKPSASIANSILGSTVLSGTAETTVELLRYDLTGKRYARSLQRYGTELERRELIFDAKTTLCELGKSDTEKREESLMSRKDELSAKVLSVIIANPGITQKEILSAVGGNAAGLLAVLKAMETRGTIRREGAGTRNSALRYHPADMPVEKAA